MKSVKVIFITGGSIFILLGFLIFICGMAGMPGTVIEPKTIYYWSGYKWNFYTIDIYRYIKSLENSFHLESMGNMFQNWPSLPSTPGAKADVIGWVKYVARIISVYIPNIAVYLINLLFVPIKILVYPVRILISLLGIDTSNKEVIQIFIRLYSLRIPFIPYW